MYKYSFIIPTKNIPSLLQRCIDSIPDREDCEIIIVDDNSDPSIVDFSRYPGLHRRNTQIIFSKEPYRGAGFARNIGIDKSSGQWLFFADSDDYYVPGFLDIIDKSLSENIDILYFCISSETPEKECRATARIKDLAKHNYDAEYIRFCLCEPWFKVISSKLVKDKGIRFEERPSGNDVMFSLIVAASTNRYKIIRDQLYCVTDRPGSIVSSPKSFSETFSKIDLKVKHNNFYAEHKLEHLQTPLITFNDIHFLLREYGIRNTYKYIKRVNENCCVVHELFKSFSKHITLFSRQY